MKNKKGVIKGTIKGSESNGSPSLQVKKLNQR